MTYIPNFKKQKTNVLKKNMLKKENIFAAVTVSLSIFFPNDSFFAFILILQSFPYSSFELEAMKILIAQYKDENYKLEKNK